MNIIRNIQTLLTNSSIGREYLDYWVSKCRNNGEAIRNLPDGIKIARLSGFSEFHASNRMIDAEERTFFNNCLLDNGDVVDVGANLGVISIFLSQRFPNRKVYAFEPNPSTYEALKYNTILNRCPNIITESFVVADRDGEVSFKVDSLDRGTTSIVSSGSKSAHLPCTTLDTYCSKHLVQQIALLKIDVEGYEELVLRGAYNLLRQKRIQMIYYEVCPDNAVRAGLEPSTPTEILSSYGYSIYKINHEGNLIPCNASHVKQVNWENWVAIYS